MFTKQRLSRQLLQLLGNVVAEDVKARLHPYECVFNQQVKIPEVLIVKRLPLKARAQDLLDVMAFAGSSDDSSR